MVGFGPIGSAPIGALPEDLHFMPTAVILQQAIIVPGDKTSAGVLIQTVTNTWMQIVRLLKSDPNILFQMGPWKFEEFIAGYYERAGFDEVTLTPRSGD